MKVNLVDTAGRETVQAALPASYFEGVHGCLVVYDLSDSESFENIPAWIANLEQCAPEAKMYDFFSFWLSHLLSYRFLYLFDLFESTAPVE